MKFHALLPAFFLLLLSLSLSFSSCKNNTEEDKELPTIYMEDPEDGDTISVSVEDSVHIHIYLSDNKALNALTVNVKNQSGTIVYTESPAVTGQTLYTFHEHFVPTGISGVEQMNLEVFVTDKSNNIALATRTFYVKP